jgi:hypothetical protein
MKGFPTLKSVCLGLTGLFFVAGSSSMSAATPPTDEKEAAVPPARSAVGSARSLSRAKPFHPKQLRPAWHLDASLNFRKTAEGTAVPRWRGKGLSSFVQQEVSRRPTYRGGALHFDGVDDALSFPLWKKGVGESWTLAVLMKVPEGIPDYRVLFGMDTAEPRALEFMYGVEGIIAPVPGYTWIVPVDNGALVPGEHWRIFIVRSDGTSVKTKLDWFQGVNQTKTQAVSGRGKRFNLGFSNDPRRTAPLALRYMAYFPRCLDDEEADKMVNWLEEKKGADHPPLALFYGGGQSNFLTSRAFLRRALASSFGNTAFAFGDTYGGTPLMNWMRDTDDGHGFEVCPYFDLSAAPAGSRASFQRQTHSGTKVLDRWELMAGTVAKNPKTLVACIFLQGESDIDDARFRWKPNGQGLYNLAYAEPHAMADSYGPRSAAWNSAIRARTGHHSMFLLYERVAFAADAPLDAIQRENLARLRKGQLDALASDPRYLLVDTEGYPRSDNVHFSDPIYQKDQIPNTGVERFSRAAIRLLKAGEKLSGLSYDARLLAMRAIDGGFEMNAAGLLACETFADHPEFSKLRTLVIPALPAVNDADRERLARCNLVQHLGDRHAPGFVAQAPATATATCLANTDTAALGTALSELLAAWGVPGPVDLTATAGN